MPMNFSKLSLIIASSSLYTLMISPAWSAVYRAADPFDMGAAQGSNATTELYNPAGLARLPKPQFVGTAIYLEQKIDFSGSVTEVPIHHTTSGSASDKYSVVTPGFFLSTPVTDKLSLGFSITTPYGNNAGPEFSDESIVRFSFTNLKLNTQNYSGAFGYRLSEKLFFGGGINYQTIEVAFNNVILAPLPPGGEAAFNNKASGDGWWWHAGFIYEFTKGTRVGAAYWSGFTEKLDGTSDAIPLNFPVPPIKVDTLKIDLPIPPVATFSILHAFSDSLGVNLTAAFTQWSKLSNLTLKNSAIGTTVTEGTYDDTWRLTFGPGYRWKPNIGFDAFVRWEQKAIPDNIRLPAEPGDSVWSFGLGGTYYFTPKIGLKVRYIVPVYPKENINATTQKNSILYVGDETRTANVLGAQLLWEF